MNSLVPKYQTSDLNATTGNYVADLSTPCSPYALALHAAHKARQARWATQATKLALEMAAPKPKPSSKSLAEPQSPPPIALDDCTEPHYNPNIFCRIKKIQTIVCNHYKISFIDLVSERRTGPVVRARQIAIYLCKTLTGRSYPDIGRRFGDRDHTTALHAVNKYANLIERDETLRLEIDALAEKCKAAMQ